MYICTYVYIYICIHVFYIYMYILIHTCTYINMCGIIKINSLLDLCSEMRRVRHLLLKQLWKARRTTKQKPVLYAADS